MLSENGHGFAHFVLEQVRVGGEVEHGEQLGVLDLQQHTGDLTRHIGVHGLKVGKKGTRGAALPGCVGRDALRAFVSVLVAGHRRGWRQRVAPVQMVGVLVLAGPWGLARRF